jgi:hypothetical protein
MKQIKMKSNRGRMSARIYFSSESNSWKAVINDDSGGLINGSHEIHGENEADLEKKSRTFMNSKLEFQQLKV